MEVLQWKEVGIVFLDIKGKIVAREKHFSWDKSKDYN